MITPIESVGSVSSIKQPIDTFLSTSRPGAVDPMAVSAFEAGVKGVRATSTSEGDLNARTVFSVPARVSDAEPADSLSSHVDAIREEMNEILRESLSGLNSSNPISKMTAEMTRSGLLTVHMSAITTVTQSLMTSVQTLLKQQI